MLKHLESFVNNGKNYSLQLVTDNDLVSSELGQELDGLIEEQYALRVWLLKPGHKYYGMRDRFISSVRIILLKNESGEFVGYVYHSTRFDLGRRFGNCYVIPSLRKTGLGSYLESAKNKYLKSVDSK